MGFGSVYNQFNLSCIVLSVILCFEPKSKKVKMKKSSNYTCEARKHEVLKVTEQLLCALSQGDLSAYQQLVSAQLTSIAPESLGNIMEGTDFSRFYFEHLRMLVMAGHGAIPMQVTILNPVVHLLTPNAACIAFMRVTQYVDKSGQVVTKRNPETLVWQKSTKWQLVHFHRSGSMIFG